MRRILIATVVGDIHATAVAVALARMGHQADLWYTSDLPVNAAASLALPASGAPQLALQLAPGLPEIDHVDVYWHRRRGAPVIDVPLLASDHAIAEREAERMATGVMVALSHSAFAVNGLRAARHAEDKLTQLRLARQLGLHLPETLVSNAPERVCRFVAAHQSGGVVVKNFAPICWLGGDGAALNFTARLTADMLPDDAVLRLTPAIYQALVPKAYEVRLTCIGDERVAVALNSQHEAAAQMDWRGVPPERLGMRRIDVPPAVLAGVDALLAALDLRFGCLDFIVTPHGDWVFLEINQMGQFLWIEQALPELPLLQMFCEMLASCDRGYRWRGHARPLGYADVLDEAAAMLKSDAERHCLPATPPNVYTEA